MVKICGHFWSEKWPQKWPSSYKSGQALVRTGQFWQFYIVFWTLCGHFWSFWPLYGHFCEKKWPRKNMKNYEKMAKIGVFLGFLGLFWQFLGCFWVKFGKKWTLWPLGHFFFILNIIIIYIYIVYEKKWPSGQNDQKWAKYAKFTCAIMRGLAQYTY